MPQSSYGQYCPLAYALDILGERWTLLIVRELLHGPRTYKLLLQNLPDMGAVNLTRRLGMLERKGIVERALIEPRTADEPYSLTEHGKKLEEILRNLAAWGLEYLELPTKYEVYSPLWSLLELQIRFRSDLAKNLNMMFELRIENETHHVVITNGQISTHVGPAASPLFTISTDAATFILILRGMIPLHEAIKLERVDIEGSMAALSRTLDILGLREKEHPLAGIKGIADAIKPDPSTRIEMYPAR